MLGRLRMDVDTAIGHYDQLVKEVFSDSKQWGSNEKFKATKLKDLMKLMVESITGDSETALLEDNLEAGICQT